MTAAAAGGPAVRVGRRFLPVAAATLPPLVAGGTVELTVPAGTPVHAVASGRVLAAESSAVGEVVLRIDDEVRVAYRRLAPSSVSVRRGKTVMAGDHLGVVAQDLGDGVATLELAASRGDGLAVDVAALLVGAADPLELFLVPPPGSRSVPPRRPAAARPRPRRLQPAPRSTRSPQPELTKSAAVSTDAARGLARSKPRPAPPTPSPAEPPPPDTEPALAPPGISTTGASNTAVPPPAAAEPPRNEDGGPPSRTSDRKPATSDDSRPSSTTSAADRRETEDNRLTASTTDAEPSKDQDGRLPAGSSDGEPRRDEGSDEGREDEGDASGGAASRASRLAGRRQRPGRTSPS